MLPKDTVMVDLNVMTLTGFHIYKKDRYIFEKRFLPWGEDNTPL